MSSDVDKTLTAFRTRIAALEEQAGAERLALPSRLVAPAFSAALFALTAVPWVTLGEDEPESFTLWGLLPKVFPAFVLLAAVIALAATALWAATLPEAFGRAKAAAGVLTAVVVAALIWLAVAARELFDATHGADVAWWPAPWLVLFCALGALTATAVRKR